MFTRIASGTNIPDWLFGDTQILHTTAASFAKVADVFAEAGLSLHNTMTGLGNSLQWEGAASEAAQNHAGTKECALEDAVRVFKNTARTMEDFAGIVDQARNTLEPLNEQLLRARADLDEFEAMVQTREAFEEEAARKRSLVEELENNIRNRVRILDDQVQDFGSTLRLVCHALTDLTDLRTAESWAVTCSPGGDFRANLVGAMERLNLLADARELAALDAAQADDPDRLRELLGALSPEEIAALAERHPQVAVLLGDTMGVKEFTDRKWPDGSPEQLTAAVLALSGSPLKRTQAIKALWHKLTPAQRRRLALTYPGVFGNLDGVAYKDRFAANRVKVSAALHMERKELLSMRKELIEAGWLKRGVHGILSHQELNNMGFTRPNLPPNASPEARHFGLFQRMWASEKRIALYRQLLDGSVLIRNRELHPNEPNSDSMKESTVRQVLVFDRHKDGRFAEVFGDLDTARNVGVFVPGTTAAIENVYQYSPSKAQVALRDPTKSTAMVVWMDADFPDSVYTNAPSPSYSLKAGEKLTNFVTTIRDERGYTNDGGPRITLEGHSYGGAIIGVADAKGAPADNFIHTESAGLSNKIFEVDQYTKEGTLGNEREVKRYAQTAKHDDIHLSQGITSKAVSIPMNWYLKGTRLSTEVLKSGIVPGGQVAGIITDHIYPELHETNDVSQKAGNTFAKHTDIFHGGDTDETDGFAQLHPGSYPADFYDKLRRNELMDDDEDGKRVHINAVMYETGTWLNAERVTTGKDHLLVTR